MRRLIEPGPIVLVSSMHKDKTDIMTMGWHMVMEYDLIGCYIWNENFSHGLIKKSKECVINIPTLELMETTVKIGNESGKDIDKFKKYGLTNEPGSLVKAPLIKECYANIECKLHDSKMISKYNLFIFKVLKVHVSKTPKYPKTFHYRGDGEFVLASGHKSLRKFFKPEYLE